MQSETRRTHDGLTMSETRLETAQPRTSAPRRADPQESAALFAGCATTIAGQEGDESARDVLVHLHLPLVEHCARRFRNRGEPFEDLVQVGTIGLIKSVDRFDTERGVEFSDLRDPDDHRRDQAPLPRQGLGDPGAAAAAGAAHADRQHRRRAHPEPGPLAHAAGAGRGDRLLGRGGVLEGLESSNAYSPAVAGRRRQLGRRSRRRCWTRSAIDGRRARARRGARVAQAAARPRSTRARRRSCCSASSRT